MPKQYIKKVTVLDERSSPKARAVRLRRLRNIANLTRAAMCAEGDINVNTYKGWELGRYGGLPRDGADKVLQRIAQEGITCHPDWLLHEIGDGPDIRPRTDSSLEPLIQPEGTEDEQIIEELLLFRKHYPSCVDLKIPDDGMEPGYAPGDTVAGVKQTGEEIDALIGQDCIVQLPTGHVMLRNLRRSPKEGAYTLVCSNPHTTVETPIITDTPLDCAGPVLWHRRKLSPHEA